VCSDARNIDTTFYVDPTALKPPGVRSLAGLRASRLDGSSKQESASCDGRLMTRPKHITVGHGSPLAGWSRAFVATSPLRPLWTRSSGSAGEARGGTRRR